MTIHELLAEQDFVRRLARSLVFDQDHVDDAVQDAWVAALRNPPKHRAAVPTWFGRVLTNLARRRSRDERRRSQREERVAASDALPSTADVLAREQQRQQVVEAVLGLPEPYRGTVLARFFDDLAPSEVARRRGVPAATVRSQLARGLEMLRQRLDHLHDGDRRAWMAALLPFARPLRTAGMGGLAATAGGLLVTKLMIGTGALALGVLGLMMWQDGGEPTPAESVAVTANGPSDAEALAGPGTDESPQRVAVDGAGAATTAREDAPTVVAAATMRGRVLRSDGSPVPDCAVRLLGIDGLALFDALPTAADRSLPAADGNRSDGRRWHLHDHRHVAAGALRGPCRCARSASHAAVRRRDAGAGRGDRPR